MLYFLLCNSELLGSESFEQVIHYSFDITELFGPRVTGKKYSRQMDDTRSESKKASPDSFG